MKAKLYNLMNWAEIEGIVYAEEDRPGEILGPCKAGTSTLYQAFFPDAEKVSLVLESEEKEKKNRKITMELADEEGFFVQTASGEIPSYYYEVKTKDGKKEIRRDPYRYVYNPLEEKTELFEKGILYDSWKYFGSRRVEMEGQKGIGFCVHVPEAMRVSLSGSFCNFDGRMYPMNRLEGTDIFTLFYPDFKEEDTYTFEVKKKDGSIYYLNDPYSLKAAEEGRIMSGGYYEEEYSWQNEDSLQKKEKGDPVFVYSLGEGEEGDKFLFQRIKNMGFTHILLPKYEPDDFFYQIPGGFPSFCRLKEFVNMAHRVGLKVIFPWKASSCHGLNRREKQNFYISNLLFSLEEYHFDGMVLFGLEELFYLDYGKGQGQWSPNIYGGNENLEGIELIKHAISIIRRDCPNALLIASIDALWWGVTEELSGGGLGFDYCIDLAFTRNVITYLTSLEEEKAERAEALMQRMSYAKEQNFIMSLDREQLEAWTGQKDLGSELRLIKLIFSYVMFLPGSSITGFSFPEQLGEEELLFYQRCHELKKEILSLGEEISTFSFVPVKGQREGILSFIKISEKEEGSLLFVANFTQEEKENLLLEVPLEGKYELIFDTNVKAFGGKEMMLPETGYGKEETEGSSSYLAQFRSKPYTMKVYRFRYFTEEEILKEAKRKGEEICRRLEEEAKEKIVRMREKRK